ncbi:MAG TPA: phosphoribosylamine--glycine ligase, partial [Chloroflexota bacterium]|nr:phosphoribosylamine--glycine ligase [Chloroflexota bacterium]
LEERTFGEAGRTLVIEEFLAGEEMSLLAFVDGRTVAPLVPARDHKRVDDDDTGPNTGGMGAIAPSRLADRYGVEHLTSTILQPIASALADRGIPYHGVLYAGLMLTADGPRVLEFNCRLGDPETQVLLPLLDEDLVDLIEATATGQLTPGPVRARAGYRCGVVLASDGYPGAYPTGLPISGLDQVDDETLVFHAGTKLVDGLLLTAGGRVLTVVGHGETLAAARQHAYQNVEKIYFAGAHYRRDIGGREADQG